MFTSTLYTLGGGGEGRMKKRGKGGVGGGGVALEFHMVEGIQLNTEWGWVATEYSIYTLLKVHPEDSRMFMACGITHIASTSPTLHQLPTSVAK